MPDEVKPLIDIREDEAFLGDKRDLEAALVHARPFAEKPIESREQNGELADAIRGIGDAISAAEENCSTAGRPYYLTHRRINADYKELLAKPKAAFEALKRKGLAFDQAERKREADDRRRDEEERQREAEKAAEEAQVAAELAAEEPTNPEARDLAAEAHGEAARAALATVPTPAPPPPKQARGAHGSLGHQVVVRHEVTDVSQLPAEHLTFNDKTIKAAIKGETAMAKAQERPVKTDLIPGVRIWTEEIPISRGRRG